MNQIKKMGCSTIIVIILMICGTIYLIPQFMGGQDSPEPTVNDNSGNDVLQNNADNNIALGSLELAEGINRDGCAVNNVSSLQSANRFYVIAPNSEFPSGTTIFARLYQDGLAIEDLPLITANQDYRSSCINFVFETANGNNFETAEYEAEFWVNGNAYNSIRFNVD